MADILNGKKSHGAKFLPETKSKRKKRRRRRRSHDQSGSDVSDSMSCDPQVVSAHPGPESPPVVLTRNQQATPGMDELSADDMSPSNEQQVWEHEIPTEPGCSPSSPLYAQQVPDQPAMEVVQESRSAHAHRSRKRGLHNADTEAATGETAPARIDPVWSTTQYELPSYSLGEDSDSNLSPYDINTVPRPTKNNPAVDVKPAWSTEVKDSPVTLDVQSQMESDPASDSYV